MKDQRKSNIDYYSEDTPNNILNSNLPPIPESTFFLPSESQMHISNLNDIHTLNNINNPNNLNKMNSNPNAFNNINNLNSSHIPKIDLKNSTIPKINDIARINNMNINNLNKINLPVSSNSVERQTSNKYSLIPPVTAAGSEESEALLMENLQKLISELKQRKAAFRDKSRLFCCGCFSVCMVMVIIVFYIFDVMKYQETCNKTKKNYIEICDAPSIGFWPRFIFIAVSSVLLIFSVYCTGPTIIIFDPFTNKVFIDKKKIFCLPSICEYKIDDLLYAYIESDTTDGTPNLSNFSFYSVILVFQNDQINLGLGRDCFLINEKIQLVNKINRYLEAYKTEPKDFKCNYGKEV